jgi:hypothetical protein
MSLVIPGLSAALSPMAMGKSATHVRDSVIAVEVKQVTAFHRQRTRTSTRDIVPETALWTLIAEAQASIIAGKVTPQIRAESASRRLALERTTSCSTPTLPWILAPSVGLEALEAGKLETRATPCGSAQAANSVFVSPIRKQT